MAEEIHRYILDSYAMLAYFQAEPGGAQISNLLKAVGEQSAELYMSWINIGEIAYLSSRHWGNKKAQEMINDLRSLPIILCEASQKRILAAAWIKAKYPISYADAFAAALAQELEASLVTGDPEFAVLQPDLQVEWLPQK